MNKVTPLLAEESVPFVGEALRRVCAAGSRLDAGTRSSCILCRCAPPLLSIPISCWHPMLRPRPMLQLRAEVGNASTVLGFVGAPFTLATYIIEGEERGGHQSVLLLPFPMQSALPSATLFCPHTHQAA